MRIMCKCRAIRPPDPRRGQNSEKADKEARSHQDDEDNIDGNRDLKSTGVEIDAKADKRSKSAYMLVR